MKIVLWIGDAENQKALAARIHARYKVDTVIVERKRNNRSLLRLVFQLLPARLFFPSISDSWKNLIAYYKNKHLSLTGAAICEVENINSEEAYKKTFAASPDLIIVSGTSIIRNKLLTLQPSIGILNLHTGLSPYVKGGPNCTNWCIATNQLHYIGNTIMWINAGIDAGDIVASKQCDFTGKESLDEVHIKVMEEAHALYLHALEKITQGARSGVAQAAIGTGITYYTKDWTLWQRYQLVKQFRKFYAQITSPEFQEKKRAVKTISINTGS